MFRWLGRLFRAWEIYNFVRYFSPMGYVVDKGIEYVLGRMRTGDWVFVGAASLLAILWLVELINWPIQLVLAIVRAIGHPLAIWPTWPPLAPLAHPGVGRFVWWILCALFWIIAVLGWLVGFVRRLWPRDEWRTIQSRVPTWRSGASVYEVVWYAPGIDPDPTPRADNRRGTPPRGVPMLVLAWLCQLFFWV